MSSEIRDFTLYLNLAERVRIMSLRLMSCNRDFETFSSQQASTRAAEFRENDVTNSLFVGSGNQAAPLLDSGTRE